MNIVEALKLSNKVRRAAWIVGSSMTVEKGIASYDFSLESLLSDDWEPILPKKKTIKKKFYQAVFSLKDNDIYKYFILENIFESPEAAEKYAQLGNLILVRFLVENPIEIEVE